MANTPSPDSSQNSGSRLGKTTRLVGDIVADEPLLIVGKFKGSIESKTNQVTVAENSQVDADIIAANVSVSGNVNGSVTALKGAKFSGTAVMTGKLATTSDFVVEKGAIFRGQVEYISDSKTDGK